MWEAQHAPELTRHPAIRQELGWRSRQAGRAAEVSMPQHVKDFLGPRPESLRGQRRWRQLAGEVAAYRNRYDITDKTRALGGTPKGPEISWQQRQEHRRLREQAERLWQRQRDHARDERDRGQEPAARAAGQGTPTPPAVGRASRVEAARRPPSLPGRQEPGQSRSR